MSDTHAGIVWNPSKTTREDLEPALEGVQIGRVSWFETSEDDPGRGAAKSAVDAGVDFVLAAGGDGTVRAVAEYLADTAADVELGIIPLGTGNLLARNLGIPLNDPPAAFSRALSQQGSPLDVGWVQITGPEGTERHAFVVMAGFGIDAHMITETDDDLKDKAGWLAYVESLGRAISASEVIDVTVSLDGNPAEKDRAHTFIVGNCGTLQGGITLLPDADPADGELDLLVLHSDGIAGWMDTMRNMVWDNGLKRLLRASGAKGGAESTAATSHRRLRSVTVDLDAPRVVEVDGDGVGEATRIEITIQSSAIRVR